MVGLWTIRLLVQVHRHWVQFTLARRGYDNLVCQTEKSLINYIIKIYVSIGFHKPYEEKFRKLHFRGRQNFSKIDTTWGDKHIDWMSSGLILQHQETRIRNHQKLILYNRTLHSYNLIWAVCHLFPQRWRTLNVQSRETIGQEDHVICLQLRRRAKIQVLRLEPLIRRFFL